MLSGSDGSRSQIARKASAVAFSAEVAGFVETAFRFR